MKTLHNTEDDKNVAQFTNTTYDRFHPKTSKVIDYVLSIDIFEQQCAVFKGMLQSPRLKDHIQTIGIDQSLSNNAIYEHKYFENIKNKWKSGQCDD